MDVIYQWLSAAVDFETALAASVFVSVGLLVFSVAGLIANRDAITRRLMPSRGPAKQDAKVTVLDEESDSGAMRLFRPLEDKLIPKNPETLSALRQRLARAGYRSRKAPMAYYVSRLVAASAAIPVAIALVPMLGFDLAPDKLLLTSLVAASFGFYLPAVWLMRAISKRQQDIRSGLPDAIDLLLICVEAGLALGAALDRVGREVGKAHPALAQELVGISLAIQAGKGREDALRECAEIVGLKEFRSLVTMLIQTEALGTSIAQGLRVHADDIRKKRFLKAEEKANKLPVKMALPLGVFVMPTLIIVIATPIIIRIIRVLVPEVS